MKIDLEPRNDLATRVVCLALGFYILFFFGSLLPGNLNWFTLATIILAAAGWMTLLISTLEGEAFNNLPWREKLDESDSD